MILSPPSSFRVRILRQCLEEIQSLAPGCVPSTPLLTLYASVWGNHGYAATIRYLRRVAHHMVKDDSSPVLECGSGASTLMMGALAVNNPRPIVSLEHHRFWAEEMQERLQYFGLSTVDLHYAPLREYGDFSWYTLPALDPIAPFGFVVCDGPPAKIPGGRYGLLPTLGPRLAEDVVILLDDTHRRGEKKILRSWQKRRHMDLVDFFAIKSFTEVVCRRSS